MKKIKLLSVFLLLSILNGYAEKLYVTSAQATNDNSLQNVLLHANSGDTILFNIQSSIIELYSELIINKSITIDGINTYNGDTITIMQNGEYARILEIDGSDNIINIENLKLTKGTKGCIYLGENNILNLIHCYIYSNFSYDAYSLSFGGIYADKNSKLTLSNCLMEDNRGLDACSIYGYYSSINIKNSSFSKDYTLSVARSITLEGGSLTIKDCNIYNNTLGIQLFNADMTMQRCSITHNSHTGNAFGGGVCVFSGTINIEDSEISNNLAGDGSGIWVIDSDLTIQNSIISDNQSTTTGGGILFSGNKLLIDKCLIENNTCYNGGGGICLWDGDDIDNIMIKNSTINNNEVTNSYNEHSGGGIYSVSVPFKLLNSTISNNKVRYGDGGGIAYYSFMGDISLVNNTIYNNTAQRKGGGIYMTLINSKAEVINNTIVNNMAQAGSGIYFGPLLLANGTEGNGTLSIFNNLIVQNNNTDFEREEDYGNAMTLIRGQSNIGSFKGSMNNVDTEFLKYDSSTDLFQNNYPLLADNGGFTKTIALSNTSIAIGKGVPYIDGFEIPLLDQRGYYRNNPPCIGAYEYDGTFNNNKIINEISSNVYSVNSSIVITNLLTYSQITIFDLNGRLLLKKITKDNQINIPMMKGVYIVKINNGYRKVVVN